MITSTSRKQSAPSNHSKRSSSSRLPIVIVAAIVAIVALFTMVAMSCSNQSKYDWNNLKLENGRMVYYEDGNAVSTTGIDVSDLQGSIDWQAVKNDGIDFAMLRCGRRGSTEGQLYTDKNYYDNVEGATRVGLPYGVYFFSQATSEQEALEEAEYVLNLINGAGVTYPVVYDQEPVTDSSGRANNLSADQLTKNAKPSANASNKPDTRLWCMATSTTSLASILTKSMLRFGMPNTLTHTPPATTTIS